MSGVTFRELLEPGAEHEFEFATVAQKTQFRKEHKANGTHDALTVSSLTSNDATNLLLPWRATLEWQQGAWYFDELIRNNNRAMLRPPQLTANTHNYNPQRLATAFGMDLTSDADRDLSGIFVHREQKRLMLLGNVGDYTITLKHNSSSSEARNRIFVATGADMALGSGEYVWIYYDPGSDGWRVVGPM